MTLPVLLRPEARAEIHAAYDWYEDAASGLGERFLEALDAVFARVSDNPAVFARAFGFRRAVVPAFPYCVYFADAADHVIVVAVFHGRRDPAVLRRRS